MESRGICPPAPKKKLKYQGLNTKEILSLHLPTISEEISPKRKKADTHYDIEDLSTDVKKKLKF